MDDIVIARAVHVLALIHWIGGVFFVTLVVLPLARSIVAGEEAMALFTAVEQRFAAQVRISAPLAGAAGFWMTYRLDAWSRFLDPQAWWMMAMLVVWLLFMTILFVIEPLLHRHPSLLAHRSPHGVLAAAYRAHRLLLLLAGVTVLGAVTGAHGLSWLG